MRFPSRLMVLASSLAVASSGLTMSGASAAPLRGGELGPTARSGEVSVASGRLLPLSDSAAAVKGLQAVAAGPCRGAYRKAGGQACASEPTQGEQPPTPRGGMMVNGVDIMYEGTGPIMDTDASPNKFLPCTGDGKSGSRVQMVYIYAGKNNIAKAESVIQRDAADMDRMLEVSAQQDGGHRRFRFVTKKSGKHCVADVMAIRVPRNALTDTDGTDAALAPHFRKYRKSASRLVMAYTEAKSPRGVCGTTTLGGPWDGGAQEPVTFGVIYGSCWDPRVSFHETGHGLGAVQENAPHAVAGSHCDEGRDVMCSGWDGQHLTCPPPSGRPESRRYWGGLYDCGKDDYFALHPKKGSYLDRNWNTANSPLLMNAKGGIGGMYGLDKNDQGDNQDNQLNGKDKGKNGKNGKNQNGKNGKNGKDKGNKKNKKQRKGKGAGGAALMAAYAVPDQVDVVAPDMVDGAELVSRDVTSADLDWMAAEDNVGVTGYDVYDATGELLGSSPEPGILLESLTPAATTVQVVARDAAGNQSEVRQVAIPAQRKAQTGTAGKAGGARLGAAPTVLTNAATGGGLQAVALKAGFGLVAATASGEGTTWATVAQADGTVLWQAAGTKLCVQGASERVEGAAVNLAACDATVPGQHWRWAQRAAGFEIVNAATQLSVGLGSTADNGDREVALFAAQPDWLTRAWVTA